MPHSYAHLLIELRRKVAARQVDTEEDPTITQIRMVKDEVKIGSALTVTASINGPTYYSMPKWRVTNLLSWWTFDNLEADRDIQGSYNGTQVGNPVYTEEDDLTLGRTRRFLRFDGAGDYVDVGDITELDGAANITWAFRFRTPSLGGESTFIARYNGVGEKQFRFSIETDGSVVLGIEAGGGEAIATLVAGSIVVDTWYTLMVVYNGGGVGNSGRLQAYLNGVAITPTFSGQSIPATLQSVTESIFIGREALTVANDYTGDILDVSIWEASLSSGEALVWHNDLVVDRIIAGFFKAT